ncbi:MAG: LamG-like jellyroll fold domain-containing protein [Kiritimatiellia bacterium]
MKRIMFIVLGAALAGAAARAGEIDLSQKRARLPGNAFTIALTVTPQAQTRVFGGVWGYVCGTGTGYWDGFRLRLKPTTCGCEPSLEIGKPRGEGSFVLEAPGALLPAGIPRHLAATWDGAVARLYVGGRCVAEKPYAGRYVQEGTLPFSIGRATYGLDYFAFAHDAARLWDEALPAERIAQMAAGVKTVPEAEVAAFAARPTDEVVAAFAAGTVEPRFAAMAQQMVYVALAGGVATRAPVKVLDAFAATIGTNDWRRALDIRLRRARALAAEGRGEESRAAYAAVWADAQRVRAPYAAWAGLAYAAALDRSGDGVRAQEVRGAAKAFARRYLWAECGAAEVAAPNRFEGVMCDQPGAAFFVSPRGNDESDGRIDRPFATLARAQRAVRELKAKGPLPKGGVTVWLRGGTYRMAETLALTEADSGEAGAPVAWRAWRRERPVLEGGWRVPRFDLSPRDIARRFPEVARRISEAARGHVVACDVRAAGYARFEPQPEYGFHRGEVGAGSAITDLYCDGAPLTLAREPNDGWLRTGAVRNTPSNSFFVATEAGDLRKWTHEPELMLTGYWRHFWADLTRHVAGAAIDVERGTIDLGTLGFAMNADRPYFFVNALCALDRPGEWYLDRATGVLYVWPLKEEGVFGRLFAKGSEYVLSSFDGPFITLEGVRDLAIEGLVLQHGRGMAVRGKDCARVVFAGNVVRRFGTDGVWFLTSTDVVVRGNVLREFGHGALRVSGGDRRTLTPSGICVVDNEIAWVERWKRTYAPGLHGDGCGTEVARNHFHDMRSSAMRLEGNDWWVASNVVERVVTESDDQGGIDIFANPTYAGDVICCNVWRDIGCGGPNAPCGQASVRFDDAVSTMTVYRNRFENCSFGHFGAVQMNGGRNNIVDNNLFVKCAKGVSITRWGQDRWEAYFERPNVKHWRTEVVDVFNPPYSERYPGIAELPRMPLVNLLTRNVMVGKGVLTDGPLATVLFGNRAFDAVPSEADLAEQPAFRPLPPERELGPRPTPDFIRAKRNDT